MNIRGLLKTIALFVPLGGCAGMSTPSSPTLTSKIFSPALTSEVSGLHNAQRDQGHALDPFKIIIEESYGQAVMRAAAKLHPDDRALMSMTTQRALETGAVGKTVTWSNPDRLVNGGVTPFGRYLPRHVGVCRVFDQFILVGGQTIVGQGAACRAISGIWTSPGYLSAKVKVQR